MNKEHSFAVIGTGSWGTALAILLAQNGHSVGLWGRNAALLRQMQTQRENKTYLPGIHLPAELNIVPDLRQLLTAAELPLLALPSSGFREWLQANADSVRNKEGLIWATKGLEEQSDSLLHEVVQNILGPQIKLAVISGPNFAGEVARRILTATTVASNHPEFAATVAQCLHNDWFRAYTSADLTGVELGGALKNVLAVASGIADGLKFGANTRAALLTRGLAEMARLTIRMGGQAETLIGLAGVGDLLLTCTDNQSRNRRLGLLLAAGSTLEQALKEIGQVVEGVKTAQVVWRLSQRLGVEMPICEQVYRILFEGMPALEAVKILLARESKPE